MDIYIYREIIYHCLEDGKLYFNRLFFSLDENTEYPFESLLTREDLQTLIKTIKSTYISIQPKSKNILA